MDSQLSDGINRRIHALVKRLATDRLEIGWTVDDTTPLFIGNHDDALFDSFEAVLLFIELENEFAFHIDDQDMTLDNFNTIRQITDYIVTHTQPQLAS